MLIWSKFVFSSLPAEILLYTNKYGDKWHISNLKLSYSTVKSITKLYEF